MDLARQYLSGNRFPWEFVPAEIRWMDNSPLLVTPAFPVGYGTM